ncbi:hypothetical protein ACN95_03240 [Gordonia sihwensis]|nr:hypothetical protein [Gordonia sihwensis]
MTSANVLQDDLLTKTRLCRVVTVQLSGSDLDDLGVQSAETLELHDEADVVLSSAGLVDSLSI